MGRSLWGMAMAGLILATPGWCQAASAAGSTTTLGRCELAVRMDRNPELRTYIERWGYPDWAEEVEVDAHAPLEGREVRLYYVRRDREAAFTRVFVLGKPRVGLKLYEVKLEPATRDMIESARLARDPGLRAELAAESALAAAESAERGAEAIAGVAERVERIVAEMERSLR